MTPTLPELLVGAQAAFSEPPPPEAAGDFMAGRIAIVGLISLLAAQEAEQGVEARATENAAIRALFARAAPAWDDRLQGRLSTLATERDEALTLSALDAANARLRRALIDLHALAEQAADAMALHHDILRLYKRMADGRALRLPQEAAPR